MPARHAPRKQAPRPDDPPGPEGSRAPAGPYAAVIERRIARLRHELDAVAGSIPWGPSLGFTAAWLGLIAVFIGLVTVDEIVTVTGVVAMLALVPALYTTIIRRRKAATLAREIDEQEHRLAGDETDGSPVDRLLHAHLDNLDRHFRLVSSHADRGFLFAVGVSGLGFLLALLGVILGLRGGSAGGDMAVVAAVSGIAMQAVAAVLFFVHVRTLGHVRALQERLAREEERLLAFHHAASLTDNEERERVLAGLVAAVVYADRAEPGSEDDDHASEVPGLLRRAST